MRRYFEFGLAGNPVTGYWFEQSNRQNFNPFGGEITTWPPSFVSMPYKEELFSVLQALSSARNLTAMWLYPRDQGNDPHPDCHAQHVPKAYDSFWVAGSQFFVNPSFLPWSGYPIFNEESTFTGNFSDPFLSQSSEPPSENG